MAVDIQIVRDLERMYGSLVQDQAEEMIFLPGYNQDNNLYGFCSKCYDTVTEQVTNARCNICFGTGFTGGYGTPVTGQNAPYQRVFGFLSPNIFVTDWQSSGPVSNEENQKVYLKMEPQPRLSDLIIDSQGNRYRIGTEGVDWSFNNIRVGWIAVLFQADPNSIIYEVPIPPIPYFVKPNQRSRNIVMQFIPDNAQTDVFP